VIPDNFFLGGGARETLMGPVGAMLMVLAVVLILALPRKLVIVPALLAVFLIPRGEVVVVGGMHLMPERIIALFGWVRIAFIRLSSGEPLFGNRFNTIDKAFLWCNFAHSTAFILLWMQKDAITNQFGYLWSALGMYFLVRFFIRDESDVYRVLKVFAIIAAINAFGMIYEQLRVQNLFEAIVGGVDPVPLIRDGKIRSQGAFGHAILAGTFGATSLPLFWLLCSYGRAKFIAAIGAISALVMVFTSVSSTPMMAMLGVAMAICFWPMRKQMRAVRWALALTLLTLHLVMKAPVWFLIARVNLVGGSASFDRAYLIDTFVRHFWDWWLIGTRDTGSWGWSMWDLSNSYVSQGESGGLVAFVFFIAIISKSFGLLGNMRKILSGQKQEWLVWLLGTALFANVMAFWGVSYWDQMQIAWFALLAIISVCAIEKQVELPEPALADSIGPAQIFWRFRTPRPSHLNPKYVKNPDKGMVRLR
jgi:hypothetical protein